MALRLAVIGVAAGAFGALFGVGGGIVIVPLLVAWIGFDARSAAATSLLAIGLIGIEGAVFYAAHGDVRPVDAALIGVPAMLGAVVGTRLQQRLSTRTLSLLFSVFLVAVAARMLV